MAQHKILVEVCFKVNYSWITSACRNKVSVNDLSNRNY